MRTLHQHRDEGLLTYSPIPMLMLDMLFLNVSNRIV